MRRESPLVRQANRRCLRRPAGGARRSRPLARARRRSWFRLRTRSRRPYRVVARACRPSCWVPQAAASHRTVVRPSSRSGISAPTRGTGHRPCAARRPTAGTARAGAAELVGARADTARDPAVREGSGARRQAQGGERAAGRDATVGRFRHQRPKRRSPDALGQVAAPIDCQPATLLRCATFCISYTPCPPSGPGRVRRVIRGPARAARWAWLSARLLSDDCPHFLEEPRQTRPIRRLVHRVEQKLPCKSAVAWAMLSHALYHGAKSRFAGRGGHRLRVEELHTEPTGRGR